MQSGMAVLTDFDGTVTKTDVGHSLTTRFAASGRKEIEEKWRQGLIGSAQSHIRQYSSMTATQQDLLAFIHRQEMDETFFPFLQYLEEEGIPLEIISDGFDFYIEPLLKKYRLKIKYRANGLNYLQKKFSFPYQNHSCWRCANCKAQAVQEYLKKGRRVIYIGDGQSDFYGALLADVIFARKGKDLERLLQKENISYLSFHSFAQILSHLKEGSYSYRFQGVSLRRCAFLSQEGISGTVRKRD